MTKNTIMIMAVNMILLFIANPPGSEKDPGLLVTGFGSLRLMLSDHEWELRERELGERKKEDFVVIVLVMVASVLENRKRDGLSGHRNLKTPMLTIYLIDAFTLSCLIDTFLCFQLLRSK